VPTVRRRQLFARGGKLSDRGFSIAAYCHSE
jgi:hypothetical protein